MGVDGELLDVEGEFAHPRMPIGLGELSWPAHLVPGPPGTEIRVADAEFTQLLDRVFRSRAHVIDTADLRGLI
ncbi:hypothetical protein, partial [Streptomyces broussonetiae]|uniref:hypothetical protein n=1 Tax=Streptomyces broussonetiae TaxID=2686304 RepID=UPI0035D6D572